MSPNYNHTSVKELNKNLDVFIGKKVKERRSALGISQDKLGSYLGITFQQVQKYEKGINRISASMLYNIATVLNVDIKWFVDGFNAVAKKDSLAENVMPVYEADIQKKKESADLLKAYYAIEDEGVRKKTADLIKSMSNSKKKTGKNTLR